MTPRRFIAVLAAPAAAAILAACGTGGGETGSRGAVSAVATTTQVGDLVRAVAGERAAVRQILGPNSDPHEYEPRPSDVTAIGDAAVVVRSGGDLDEWLGDLLASAGSDAATVTLLDAMRPRAGAGHDDEPHAGDGGHGDEVDPHWWHDPRNARVAIAQIRDALSAADAAGRATYAANARTYTAALDRLDRAIAGCFEQIPAARRKLVTDHDALGYFADRYGIEIVGAVFPARSAQAQASAGEVARLVRMIRAEGVTTIFPQSAASTRLVRAVARDAGAAVGPALHADALGAEGSAGASYLGALRANALALAAGMRAGTAAPACMLPPIS